MRYVVIPQALRGIVPPLLNNCISLQKDTALVAIIGTIDAFNQSKIIAANNFNLSAVTTVAILFILITIPQARLVDKLTERDRRRIRSGGGACRNRPCCETLRPDGGPLGHGARRGRT